MYSIVIAILMLGHFDIDSPKGTSIRNGIQSNAFRSDGYHVPGFITQA